jgi:hypothetical protein
VWTPHDPAGNVYHHNISIADLRLPSSRIVEQVEVHTTMRTGALRLTDENQAAFPRVFLTSQAISVPVDDWALTHLTDTPIDLRSTVLIERSSGADLAPSTVLAGPPVADDERAEIVRSSPNSVAVQVRASAARYLVMTDTDFPGWHATIDGKPVPIERADYLFRAVAVPPGVHLVEWHYAPDSLAVGAIVTAMALGGMVVCGLYGRRGACPTTPRTDTHAPGSPSSVRPAGSRPGSD